VTTVFHSQNLRYWGDAQSRNFRIENVVAIPELGLQSLVENNKFFAEYTGVKTASRKREK